MNYRAVNFFFLQSLSKYGYIANDYLCDLNQEHTNFKMLSRKTIKTCNVKR